MKRAETLRTYLDSLPDVENIGWLLATNGRGEKTRRSGEAR